MCCWGSDARTPATDEPATSSTEVGSVVGLGDRPTCSSLTLGDPPPGRLVLKLFAGGSPDPPGRGADAGNVRFSWRPPGRRPIRTSLLRRKRPPRHKVREVGSRLVPGAEIGDGRRPCLQGSHHLDLDVEAETRPDGVVDL